MKRYSAFKPLGSFYKGKSKCSNAKVIFEVMEVMNEVMDNIR